MVGFVMGFEITLEMCGSDRINIDSLSIRECIGLCIEKMFPDRLIVTDILNEIKDSGCYEREIDGCLLRIREYIAPHIRAQIDGH